MIKIKCVICLISFYLMTSVVFAQEQFPFLGQVKVENAYVRAGANQNFEPLCRLSQGVEVLVFDQSYRWYKIRLPKEANSFVSDQFIQIAESGFAQITANRVNIRAARGPKATVLGQLNQSDQIKIKEKFEGWVQIEPPQGTVGWILSELVEFKTDVIPEGMLQLPAVESQSNELNSDVNHSTNLIESENSLISSQEAVIPDALIDNHLTSPTQEIVSLESFKEVPVLSSLPNQTSSSQSIEVDEDNQTQHEQSKKETVQGQSFSLDSSVSIADLKSVVAAPVFVGVSQIVVSGRIVVLESSKQPTSDVTHQLLTDDGQIYFLTGPMDLIKSFEGQHVNVEGIVKEASKAFYQHFLIEVLDINTLL